jgi:hypothetical protein
MPRDQAHYFLKTRHTGGVAETIPSGRLLQPLSKAAYKDQNYTLSQSASLSPNLDITRMCVKPEGNKPRHRDNRAWRRRPLTPQRNAPETDRQELGFQPLVIKGVIGLE